MKYIYHIRKAETRCQYDFFVFCSLTRNKARDNSQLEVQ